MNDEFWSQKSSWVATLIEEVLDACLADLPASNRQDGTVAGEPDIAGRWRESADMRAIVSLWEALEEQRQAADRGLESSRDPMSERRVLIDRLCGRVRKKLSREPDPTQCTDTFWRMRIWDTLFEEFDSHNLLQARSVVGVLLASHLKTAVQRWLGEKWARVPWKWAIARAQREVTPPMKRDFVSECEQDLAVRLLESAPRRIRETGPYLKTCAIHVAHDHVRRILGRKSITPVPVEEGVVCDAPIVRLGEDALEDIPGSGDNPEEMLRRKELPRPVRAAVALAAKHEAEKSADGLPIATHCALLHYHQSLTLGEILAIYPRLDNTNNVGVRVHRGLKGIKKAMLDLMGGDGLIGTGSVR